MLSRFTNSLAIVLLLASVGSAQTVRFDTNVGNFDVVLNPGGIPDLQGHVDNILQYVDGGFYDNLLINRTAPGFVMQLGRFQIESIFPPSDGSGFLDNFDDRFDPVFVDADGDETVDFDTTDLSNIRNTISLALSGGDSNSGTSEFFINFGDNSRLDPKDGVTFAPNDLMMERPEPDFVTFAMVPDMTTIDLIFQLNNVNLFGGTFSDVRMLDNDTLVYVERAFVLGAVLPATAGASSGSSSAPLAAAFGTAAVPEPPALVLAVGALMLLTLLKRR